MGSRKHSFLNTTEPITGWRVSQHDCVALCFKTFSEKVKKEGKEKEAPQACFPLPEFLSLLSSHCGPLPCQHRAAVTEPPRKAMPKTLCAKVPMSLQLHRQHFQIFSSAVPREPSLPVSVTSHRHVRPGRVGGKALQLRRRNRGPENVKPRKAFWRASCQGQLGSAAGLRCLYLHTPHSF